MRALYIYEKQQSSAPDSECEEDEVSEMLTPRTSESRDSRCTLPGLRLVIATTLVIAVMVACIINLMPGTTRSAPSATFGDETIGLFETDEFKGLMHSQVRTLMEQMGMKEEDQDDRTTSAVHKHVDTAIASATQYIGKHASQSEVNSLRNARLGREGWETLRVLITSISDKQVQNVGHAVVQEARSNLLAGPAEIGKKVAARLKKEHLEVVAQKLLPVKLRSALIQRWASANATKDDIWKMMLDPTGRNLAQIRDNNTESKIIRSSALQERRLRTGSWGGPFKLNWAELTVGITAVVMTTAAEILLHIDFFIPNLDIPRWVHGLLIVPAFSTGSLSCAIGYSFWCQYFLGALGINALDAIAVAMGLHLDTDIRRL